MTIWPLITLELSKLWRRPETLTLLAGLFFLPLLIIVPLRYLMGALLVRGLYDGFSMATGLLKLVSAFLFPHFAVILVGALTAARQVDDGSLKTLLRYLAKHVALASFAVGSIVALAIGSLAGYLLFLSGGIQAAGVATYTSFKVWAWQGFLSFLGLSVMGALVLFVGLKVGVGGSMGLGLGSLVAMKGLERLDKLREFVPTFLSESTHYSSSAPTLNTSHGILLLIGYLAFILVSGVLTMRRMDLQK